MSCRSSGARRAGGHMSELRLDQNNLPIENMVIEPCLDAENAWVNWLATMPDMPGYIGIGANPTDALTNLLAEIGRGPLHKVKVSVYGSKSHRNEIDVHCREKAAMRSIIDDGKRGDNVAEAADKFRISKGDLYAWIKRYDEVMQSCGGNDQLEKMHRKAMFAPYANAAPTTDDDKIAAAYQQQWRARAKFPKTTEIAEPQS